MKFINSKLFHYVFKNNYCYFLQTGEMEVKNPLFQDDPTPAKSSVTKPGEEVQKK